MADGAEGRDRRRADALVGESGVAVPEMRARAPRSSSMSRSYSASGTSGSSSA
jgi:hypothetical protein